MAAMLAAVAAAAIVTFQQPEPVEVRGVWIPNSYSSFFQSRKNVETQMALLAEAGVNVIFPVVWSKGHTLFDSAVAEEVVGRRVDPRYGRRDPLAEVLFEAHRHGIEVVPWFEYGFAAGHETYPGKALVTHPEWAAIGVDGQPVVKNGFAWMNSLAEGPQDFLTDLVVECATRYDVDGVQGDDRLPALAEEFNTILGFIEQLNEVDIEGVEPMTSVTPQRLKRREDVVTDGDQQEKVLSNAPDAREGFFAVPKVHDARVSAGWALVFIALLYTTAPAVAAMARLNLHETIQPAGGENLKYDDRPAWFRNWEKTGLLKFEDKNGDGRIQYFDEKGMLAARNLFGH